MTDLLTSDQSGSNFLQPLPLAKRRKVYRPSGCDRSDYLIGIATGRSGEPLAPRSLIGAPMKTNS